MPQLCWRGSLSVLLSLVAVDALAAQAAWTRLYPPTSPIGRTALGFAYDAARQRMVMFGGLGASGGYNPQTWTWDGAAWTVRANGPSARAYHGMAYDPARARTVMFGGSGTTAYLDDTWEWDGVAWREILPAVRPPARTSHGMTWDSQRQRIAVCSGRGSAYFSDLWEWDGATWTQRAAANTPRRESPSFAFDPVTQSLLVFGGYDPAAADVVAETWLFNGVAWQLRNPAHAPSPRIGAASTVDLARNRIVLLGGTGQLTSDAFAWEWDGSDWRQRLVESPSPREYAGLAYDGARREVVLFSGSGMQDTWVYRTSSPADFVTYGAGCAGAAGAPVLAPQNGALPWLGDTFRSQVANLDAACPGVFFIMSFAASPPLSLAPFGLTGCSAYLGFDEAVFALVNAGVAVRTLALPNAPALAGLHAFQQVLAIDATAAGGATVSNAADLRLGVR